MSVPVTILCGELGAGKTTLLSGLLESTERDIAVLVNDVGEVNVDADLVEARTELETGDEVVALENGCICCSLGGDLSRAVIRLWKEAEFDHLVVEASGVGEPEPIAQQFVRGPAGGPYDLETVATVVDARRFYDRVAEADGRPVRRGPDETGTRPLADLLLEQVKFCDLLVVNKCDLVDEAERERVVALLEALQPEAEIVTTEYGAVDLETLLDGDYFDFSAARESAGWKRAIENDADERGHDEEHGHDHSDQRDHEHDHAHPPERYGIDVETYHRRRPFHPGRFASLLRSLPAGLVRTKGLAWTAGREKQAVTMSFAGTETTLEVTGRWIASFSEERQETFRQGQPDLSWDEEWGDRETRLALIGRDLSWDDLESRFDDCLLTDAEMDEDWHSYENPAPTGTGETVTISSADRTAEASRE